jgi:predicted RNA binding protein YcfA (HicA-like mRNA interferase family)
LKKAGWSLARSKGGHDVFKHPKAKHSIPVPRHALKAPLVRGIMKASKVEEQLEKKGRFVSGPIKQPYKSDTIVTSVKEATDEREYDYEGDMAKSDLRSIIHNAQTLHDMLDDNTNLAEWCQSKITLAEDYISTVTNYMRSEMNEEVEQIDELSKGTLGSYIKKARFSGEHHNWRANVARAKQDQNISMKKHDNRIKGIDKAVDRLTKEEVVQEDKNDYQRKIEKNNKNFIAASKRQKNPLTNVHTAQTKQKPVKEDVELDEMVIVKTNKPIGTRVADIGPGGKEYNVKTNKAYDDAKRKQPQGADFAAQRRKERLAKSGRMDEKKNLPGLWANIHAKRKRGEPPAKPGDKDYPKTLNIESAAEPTEGEMKGKQGYSRKAQIVMNAAKGKKSDSSDKFQKDPELSSEIHKT